MKYALRIGAIPDGREPKPGLTVAARRIDNGTTLATGVTDANGLVTFSADGHWPPWFVIIEGQPGGFKFWRSDEVHGAGAISLAEVPHALRAMGDGVVRGHLGDLAPSVLGTTLSLATGTALCAGYPVHNGTADTFPLARPAVSTRIDRLVAWVKPLGATSNPGEAGFSVLTGVEGAAATAVTQTADLHEVSLATITVPTAGTLTLTDTREYVLQERNPVQGVVRLASVTTTNASGEYLTGLIITLDIPRSGNYIIEATLTGQQLETQVITSWVLQNTYGPTFNSLAMSSPGQVDIDSTGRILIADTGNSRLVILASDGTYATGITGLTGITGVCRDGSDNIYITLTNVVRKYNSALTLQWQQTVLTALKHVATDSTHLYVIDHDAETIKKRLCSTGAIVATLSGPGSGNGQLSDPLGIAYSSTDSLLYVVDAGNSRVQVFTTTGTYIRQFPISANARGIAIDASGDVLVAEYGQDAVKRYTTVGVFIDSFSQVDPDGIGMASGDVPWVSNAGAGTIAKWDEAITSGGYGQIAIEIDGVVSDYTGSGNRDSSVATSATATKAGGGTVVIRAFGKATASTLTLKGLVLSAKATPQR